MPPASDLVRTFRNGGFPTKVVDVAGSVGLLSRIHVVGSVICGKEVVLRMKPSASARALFSTRPEVVTTGGFWECGLGAFISMG
jgi:hypothetical protein